MALLPDGSEGKQELTEVFQPLLQLLKLLTKLSAIFVALFLRADRKDVFGNHKEIFIINLQKGCRQKPLLLSKLPFGGKVVFCIEHFRQIWPVGQVGS